MRRRGLRGNEGQGRGRVASLQVLAGLLELWIRASWGRGMEDSEQRGHAITSEGLLNAKIVRSCDTANENARSGAQAVLGKEAEIPGGEHARVLEVAGFENTPVLKGAVLRVVSTWC